MRRNRGGKREREKDVKKEEFERIDKTKEEEPEEGEEGIHEAAMIRPAIRFAISGRLRWLAGLIWPFKTPV